MHGGAGGSGAPLGNSNAVKHGLYTAEAILLRRAIMDEVAEAAVSLKALSKATGETD